jgi:hypothetical protein
VGAVAVLSGCGGGDSSSPPAQNSSQSTAVGGQWAVTCQPQSSDCPNFSFTFSPNGDVIASDLPGQSGVTKGHASIDNGVLSFVIDRRYTFQGTLDASGNTATGTLASDDEDGSSSTTLNVVATRIS